MSNRQQTLISYLGFSPVFVRQGRAPAGMEQQVFAWSTFQYETDERDDREERKGDLHGGQLHRQNRAARGEPTGPPPPRASSGRGRGGRGRGGHNGLNGQNGQGAQDELQPKICARAQEGVPNLAKGKPQELSDDLFWDKPIC